MGLTSQQAEVPKLWGFADGTIPTAAEHPSVTTASGAGWCGPLCMAVVQDVAPQLQAEPGSMLGHCPPASSDPHRKTSS